MGVWHASALLRRPLRLLPTLAPLVRLTQNVVPAVLNMAFQKTLDLYVGLILPKLADGPKSQLQLGVPLYALEALQRAGHVVLRTHRVGCIGLQLWYRKGTEPITEVRDCALMTFRAWSGLRERNRQDQCGLHQEWAGPRSCRCGAFIGRISLG